MLLHVEGQNPDPRRVDAQMRKAPVIRHAGDEKPVETDKHLRPVGGRDARRTKRQRLVKGQPFKVGFGHGKYQRLSRGTARDDRFDDSVRAYRNKRCRFLNQRALSVKGSAAMSSGVFMSSGNTSNSASR